MKLIREHRMLKDGHQLPSDGIFWIIGEEILQFSSDVDTRSTLFFQGKDYLHSQTWLTLRDKYLVNGSQVPCDYYPRGRVVVKWDKEERLFQAQVFMDKCLYPEHWDRILTNFNLELPNCRVEYAGNSGFGNSHYKCHNCNNKGR